MTQEEFENELVKLHPEIAKIFEDENEIKSIQVPTIDESMPIYHHWENVS